ncbi:TetR/AcrR family transcriptional regulator [Nocardia yunnanensis]|uniref:TetR/AcrR family transcriptional regulator n=1 Tax=Nocardia yunnanensis TaxID=2382165 RepID=A0A386Z8R1_9NOCA|nr:TetR/AcrR family transcriptional regulator [Nocardia yunnanensis]AYF73553.1 TetR/AcrR family transcriptional regulator [Nocardia yunnanensis]
MTTARASRGRIDKRQAILDAALTVFARRGYAQACVQEIADTAAVAKPTVYNHLTDKENLFREAISAAADTVGAVAETALEPLRAPGADLGAALGETAVLLLRTCSDERALALHRLTYAQAADFPDLVDTVLRRTTIRLRETLADRLARLALAGRLRHSDPTVAAEQFLALLSGPLEARTHQGNRAISAAELQAIAEAATDTFLRAYLAREETA